MAKLHNVLICCEGSDGSGKTKLSQFLIEKYRFNYFHNGLYKDVKTAHLDCISTIQRSMDKYGNNWIMDRLSLSEYVYGTIFRNGPAYDYHWMEGVVKSLFKKYQLIICKPQKDLVVKKHAERLSQGDEEFDTVEKVYDLYDEVSKDSSLDAYIYDYTEDPDYSKISQFLEEKFGDKDE